MRVLIQDPTFRFYLEKLLLFLLLKKSRFFVYLKYCFFRKLGIIFQSSFPTLYILFFMSPSKIIEFTLFDTTISVNSVSISFIISYQSIAILLFCNQKVLPICKSLTTNSLLICLSSNTSINKAGLFSTIL